MDRSTMASSLGVEVREQVAQLAQVELAEALEERRAPRAWR